MAGGYDLGIAFDGDADRCLLVDETGHTHRRRQGHGCLRCRLCSRQGKLSGNAIVATVMSNLGLHEYCRKERASSVVCTAVGDRNVLEKMLECGYAIGGEQSGHTIFREYATTGDGELTALQFLQALRRSGKAGLRTGSLLPPAIHRCLSMWPYPTFPASRMLSWQDPTAAGTLSRRWRRSSGREGTCSDPSLRYGGPDSGHGGGENHRGCPKSGGRFS